MFAITSDLVKARQHDLLVAGDRSRRTGRVLRSASVGSSLAAVARAASLRLRRDTELAPGPFAPCAC